MDFGTHSFRLGFSGEDGPKYYFPTAVGVTRQSVGGASSVASDRTVGAGEAMDVDAPAASSGETKKFRCGYQALNVKTDNVDIECPLEDGLVSDWEGLEKLMDFGFRHMMRIDPSNYGLLLSEVPYNTPAQREQFCRLVFETFGFKYMFIAKSPVLSSFSVGKSAALVVDCGHIGTTVTPVVEGFALTSCIRRSPFGGQFLNEELRAVFERENVKPRPIFSFEKTKLGADQYQVRELDLPNITPSFWNYHTQNMIADVKESLLLVSEAPFDEEKNTNLPALSYELPDGQSLSLGTERFSIPEKLFLPSAAAAREMNESLDALDGEALHLSAYASLRLTDADKRKDIQNSVLLTGGTCSLRGLNKRFEREIQCLPSQTKIKLASIPTAAGLDRRQNPWIGGSILASLGNFQHLWISEKEFEDHGPSCVNTKCP